MGTLATAYSLACLAIGLYVGWIGSQQRQLSQRLAELESRQADSLSRSEFSSPDGSSNRSHSRAA